MLLKKSGHALKLWTWLLGGILATGIAVFLAFLGRYYSLALFPYLWALSALPDPTLRILLWHLFEVGGFGSSATLRSEILSLLLTVFAYGQFLVYALVLWLASRRGWLRSVACGILLLHVFAVSLAAAVCLTRGWPDKSNEGQHAREAGEIYGD